MSGPSFAANSLTRGAEHAAGDASDEGRLRILLVCDRFPWPLQNGQNLRIFHYVRELRGRHDFDLVCHGEAAPPAEIVPLFQRIETLYKPAPSGRRPGLRGVRDAFSLQAFANPRAHVTKHLAHVAATRRYDLVWVSGWEMVGSLPERIPAPLLMDAVDEGVLEHWRELRRPRSIGHLVRTAKQLLLNYRFERTYFARARRCLFVSEVDSAFFSRVCAGVPVSTVHNGVDAEFFRPLGLDRSPRTIVFEGKIGFRPNAEGLRHFLTEIFPRIRSAEPGVRFVIVGKDPPEDIVRLSSAHIEVTGFVDDVRPYVDRAAVFVCPLITGAGIKNKVLQAWAMAKPVVATTASVGGLKAVEGENILVRDRPREFAEAVVRLLREPEFGANLGRRGRQTVLEDYTWAAKAQELEAVMRSVAQR
jgi:glycosyltransferase involved in cell wall biosynthesis